MIRFHLYSKHENKPEKNQIKASDCSSVSVDNMETGQKSTGCK